MSNKDAPLPLDDILAEANPRAYVDGVSVVMRVGPMPDVTPISETPIDWQQTEEPNRWEEPFSAVRGEDHYRTAFDELLGPEAEGLYLSPADLVRDPGNQHDANAIRVEVDEQLVGYVERELAAVVAPVLDQASTPRLVVPGVIHADPRANERHVWLWLRRRLSEGPALPIPVEWADAHVASPRTEVEAEDETASDTAVGRYFALNDEAVRAWSDRDLDRLVEVAREVLVLRPDLGMDVAPRSDAFNLAGPVAAALGERDLLVAMRDAMQRGGASAEVVAELEGFLADEQRARGVLAFVTDDPGTLQKDLSAKLGEDKSVVSTSCYYLALVGLLRREKVGNSYALYVA